MKIFCIGRNYAEHAKELGNQVPEAPVLFMKPPTAVLKGKDFYLPDFSSDMHYECELVYRFGKNGKNIDEKFALRYIDAVTVGIDFTARDVQNRQKQKGLPWEIAKAFDNSAVLGEWNELSEGDAGKNMHFSMQMDKNIVQSGQSAEMIFPLQTLISYISSYFTIQQGDILFTGTPSGVGQAKAGSVLEGFLESEKKFEVRIK